MKDLEIFDFGFSPALLTYPPNCSGPDCCAQRSGAQTGLAAGLAYMGIRNKFHLAASRGPP